MTDFILQNVPGSGAVAGSPGFWAYLINDTNVSGDETGTTYMLSNNEVRATQFLMPVTMTVSHLTFNLTTNVAASKVDFGFYNAAGTALIATTGGTSSAGSTGATRVALTSPATLNANTMYWFAWTTNNNTVAITNMLMGTSFQASINAGAVRSGTSGTASTGGALNSTLGVMSSVQLRIPLVYFD